MHFFKENSSLWSGIRSMPPGKCLQVNKRAGTFIPDPRVVWSRASIFNLPKKRGDIEK